MNYDLRPMLATLTDKAFDDPDWLFETANWTARKYLIDDGDIDLRMLVITRLVRAFLEASAVALR